MRRWYAIDNGSRPLHLHGWRRLESRFAAAGHIPVDRPSLWIAIVYGPRSDHLVESGQFRFMGQTEFRGLGCLCCDLGLQTRCQLGLNVLPGVLPVLRRSGFAGDVGWVRIEVP